MKKTILFMLCLMFLIPVFGEEKDSREFFITLDKRGESDFYFHDGNKNKISIISFPVSTSLSDEYILGTSFSIYYKLFREPGQNGVKLYLEFCSNPNADSSDQYMLVLAGASADDAGLNFSYELSDSLGPVGSFDATGKNFEKLSQDDRCRVIISNNAMAYNTKLEGNVGVDLSVTVNTAKVQVGTYRGYAILTLSSI